MRRYLSPVKVFVALLLLGSAGTSCRSRAIPCPSFSHHQTLSDQQDEVAAVSPQNERFGQ